jgi:hypothetical protein
MTVNDNDKGHYCDRDQQASRHVTSSHGHEGGSGIERCGRARLLATSRASGVASIETRCWHGSTRVVSSWERVC